VRSLHGPTTPHTKNSSYSSRSYTLHLHVTFKSAENSGNINCEFYKILENFILLILVMVLVFKGRLNEEFGGKPEGGGLMFLPEL